MWKGFFCFVIGTASGSFGVWFFNKESESILNSWPILSSVKRTHTTFATSGSSTVACILSINPRAPLTIPLFLYLLLEWLDVIITGAPSLKKILVGSCPVLVKGSFSDILGAIGLFVDLSIAFEKYLLLFGNSFSSFSLLIASLALLLVTIIENCPDAYFWLSSSLGHVPTWFFKYSVTFSSQIPFLTSSQTSENSSSWLRILVVR